MIHFQSEIAVALALSAFGSLATFCLTRPRKGKIQLPVHADGSLDATSNRDPFDVTTPDDVIDGYPVDEEAFWKEVCLFLSL